MKLKNEVGPITFSVFICTKVLKYFSGYNRAAYSRWTALIMPNSFLRKGKWSLYTSIYSLFSIVHPNN